MKKDKQSSKFIYFPDNTHGTIAINPLSLPYALYMSVLEIDGVGGSQSSHDTHQLHKIAAKNLKYKIENGEVSINLKIEIERRMNAAEVVSKVQKTIKEQLQYIFDIVVGDVNVEIMNIVA